MTVINFTIENAIAKPSALWVKAALKDKPFILASSSPRRRQVLELLGLNFQICNPIVDESLLASGDAAVFAETIAASKVDAIKSKFPDQLIIGADTVVVLGERILGKPGDADEAIEMLHLLRDKEHCVITAVAACGHGNYQLIVSHEKTRVFFRNYTETELREYVTSGEPMDKAGSYGIQGMGSILVDKIEGELDNVIGLPLNCLANLLGKSEYVGNRI